MATLLFFLTKTVLIILLQCNILTKMALIANYMKFSRIINLTLLLSVLAVPLQGCDQVKGKLAELIAPRTPQQALEAANQKIADKKYGEALAELEKLGTSDPSVGGQIAWAAAKSSFQTGQADKGYAYLSQALKASAATAQDAMAEPLFEPVRTEIRFVTLLTEAAPSSPAMPPSTEVSAGGDVSIKVNPNGSTEVKAGSVSIKLP